MPPEHVPMNSTEVTSEAAIEERTQDLLGRVPVLRQRFQELVSTPRALILPAFLEQGAPR